MGEISGALQSQIAPPVSQFNELEFSSAKVEKQAEEENLDSNRTDFRDLIANSQEEIQKEREAKKLGDLSAGSESEFFEKLAEQTKPQREVKKDLKKDDFLQLFVAQLQNQDPLNPDDGTEMASKLAQFNGLEQMMNMNKTMEKMVQAQSTDRNLQLVNYVGKEIAVEGGRFKLDDGKISQSVFDLPTAATSATMTVRDSSGQVVAEQQMGPVEAGSHPFSWDGKNSAGNPLNNGLYHYSIYAKDIDGNQIPSTITANTLITGVDIKSDNGNLFTDLGSVKFADIRSVGNPGYDKDRPAEKAVEQLNNSGAVEAFKQRKAAKAYEKQLPNVTQNQTNPAVKAEASPNKADMSAETGKSKQDTDKSTGIAKT